MIIIDSNEQRYEKIYSNVDYKVCNFLEKQTGADICVSPIQIPPKTPELLAKHIEAGCLLIQRKSGTDAIQSIERLDEVITRMIECGSRQSQRVLLTVGLWEKTPSGNLMIDGNITPCMYMNMILVLSSWCDKGGISIHLQSNDLIPEYLKHREKSVIDYRNDPTPKPFFKKELPLQSLTRIDDWRRTISTFPFIGPERSNMLRDRMLQAQTSDDLLTALIWLTDTRKSKEVKGIAKTIRDACRSWLGLPDGWNLDITHESEE